MSLPNKIRVKGEEEVKDSKGKSGSKCYHLLVSQAGGHCFMDLISL